MNADAAFGIFYICLVLGGLFGLMAIGEVIMNILMRIPFFRKKMDAFFDSLPMSDPDW